MRRALGIALVAVSASVSHGQTPLADSLRERALRVAPSTLASEARANPSALRDAIAETMRRAVKAPAGRAEELAVARALAGAYAEAWRDSFLVREVARFAAWSPAQQRAKVRGDSTRRAGIAAFSSRGAGAAIVIWRAAVPRAMAIGDTAGAGALLGNIGAGYLAEEQPDSAEAYLDRARRMAAAVGDVRVEANAVGELAGISQLRGDLARARTHYTAALALRARIGDSRGIAADYNNLGTLMQDLGDLDEARGYFENALAINRRDGRDEHAATNLINLAGLFALSGEYARAAILYQDALVTWRARAMWVDVADALRGLGQLELRRGEYSAARAAFRESAEILDDVGAVGDRITARRDLASAMAAAGDLQGAVDLLGRAQLLADSAGTRSPHRAAVAMSRADLAVQLNSFAEAQRLYTQAGLLHRQAGDLNGQAQAQQGLGRLLLERAEYARAQPLFETALRAQIAAGDRRGIALTRLDLGQLARDRGDTAVARRHLTRAIAELDTLGDPVGSAFAIGELAKLHARAGLRVSAESLYRTGLLRLDRRSAPDIAWQLRLGLALVLRERGADADAARELRLAIAEVERTAHSLTLAERRSAYRADKADAYLQLALIEHARGRPGTVFDVSERLRARETLEILANGRVAQPRDTAADLVTREQDLRRRIAELASSTEESQSVDGSFRGGDIKVAVAARSEALERTRQEYAELLLEIRERAPRHATLVSPEPASWRDVAARLAPAEALVEYLVSGSTALAIIVTRDTIATVDLAAGRRDLARLVEFARGTMEPRSGARPDSLWRTPLQRLNDHLITPVEETGLLRGVTQLVVVPHLELHYLPFAALMGRDSAARFLVERYTLRYAPSASVFVTLADRSRSRTATGAVGFAPKPTELPASLAEIRTAARSGGEGRTFTGALATEETFRRVAPSRRVIHLATYGILNKSNPLFSFVELAPGSGHDGRLEVHEVFGLQLSAELVVLSACETGLGSGSLADVPAGDDWIGLTRAFLHAGAAQVMATLWPVQDRPTGALMQLFYERLSPEADVARALAEAQRAMLANPATSHPFHWAGFVVTGHGGLKRPIK